MGYNHTYVTFNFVRQYLREHAQTITMNTKLLYTTNQKSYSPNNKSFREFPVDSNNKPW